jgi:hypothetical protein
VTALLAKPCFICKAPTFTTGGRFFDHEAVFAAWSAHNQIMFDWRSRFDGVREGLRWAALDETAEGSCATCALAWAVRETGWSDRYPAKDVPLGNPACGAVP